jgi:hypothetical protein
MSVPRWAVSSVATLLLFAGPSARASHTALFTQPSQPLFHAQEC